MARNRHFYWPQNPVAKEVCELCDSHAYYNARIKIKFTDPNTSKVVVQEFNMLLCEKHADRMDCQVDKVVSVRKSIIVI